MPTWTEKQRLLALETPLGADKLLLRSFSGTEGISQLFSFQLDLLSEDLRVDFDKIVGKNITFGIKLPDQGQERWFNGFVSRFVQLPTEERLAHYQAQVVPWLWFLTRTADCRIFQNKTVPDIVQKVFSDFGFRDFEMELQGTYESWEYCVQYRETAFHFISRLLEQEGILYFFKHARGKHTLVLADSPAAHKPCPNQRRARFEHFVGPGYKLNEDSVLSWRYEQQLRSGKYAFTDYNFEMPANDLLSTITSSIDQGGNQRFEIYDYPGEFYKRARGENWVRVRMEEEEAAHTIASGESNCRAFCSGFRFEFADYEPRDQAGSYVLTTVTHSGEEAGFYSGAGSETEGKYSNRFTAIPHSVPFRPPRRTPWPLVQGAQTAVVVGPAGEEIHTDKYGRVKVQFHWDRLGRHDENSSCWMRVSQPWAGKNWGAMWIPRIGQEVVVEFLEGDPDRPLITGRLYNAIEMPPYTLPDEQTKSTFKSHSSKGGGGFNELCFEDKKGEEQVFLHAEKDLDIRVKNDRRETIGQDRHLIVTRDLVEEIRRDHHLAILGKEALQVTGSQSLTVEGSAIQKVGGGASLSAGGAILIEGKTVVIDGATGLTIKCGGSFVTVNSGGVFISGPLVSLNSGGAALAAAAASPVRPLAAKEADKRLPGGASTGAAAAAAEHNPDSSENEEKTAWIEIQLVDEDDKPVPGECYQVTLPDGSLASGTLDEKGCARIEHIDPGSCQITFPELDKEAWEPK